MPSVMFLPGMKAPGGTKTPFMPARAFDVIPPGQSYNDVIRARVGG